MTYDYREVHAEKVTVKGISCEFCNMRIDRSTVPDGKYQYEIANGDSKCIPARVKRGIMVNFYGTLFCEQELPLGSDGVMWYTESFGKDSKENTGSSCYGKEGYVMGEQGECMHLVNSFLCSEGKHQNYPCPYRYGDGGCSSYIKVTEEMARHWKEHGRLVLRVTSREPLEVQIVD